MNLGWLEEIHYSMGWLTPLTPIEEEEGGVEEREGEERETQMIHIPYLDPIAAQQCGGCGRSQMRVTLESGGQST